MSSAGAEAGARRRWSLLAVVALVACDGACASEGDAPRPRASASVAPAAASTSSPAPASGRIAFVRERDEGKGVFVLDLATGEASPLLEKELDFYPGPSKGDQLLLVSAEDRGELHREQLWRWRDGHLHELGPASRMVRNPSWLPDGSGVVVESSRDAFRDLYRVTEEGAERLTHTRTGAFEPAVHPSGDRVAYVSSDEGNPELFVRSLAPDQDRSPRRLTWSKGDDKAPQWSPDGRSIAWVSVRGGVGNVFLMNADGSRPRALSPSDRDQAEPRWSPDGAHLAFVERREGRHTSIVVARPTGERVLETGSTSVDQSPAWSPDGRSIAFSSDRTGDTEIHTVTVEGEIHRRTTRPGPDWLPRWID